MLTPTPAKSQLIITNLESDFQTCQGLEPVVACLSVLYNWFGFHSIGKKEVIGQLGGKLPFPQNSLKVDPVKVHPLTHLLPIPIWHHFAIFLSDSVVDSFLPRKSLCSPCWQHTSGRSERNEYQPQKDWFLPLCFGSLTRKMQNGFGKKLIEVTNVTLRRTEACP